MSRSKKQYSATLKIPEEYVHLHDKTTGAALDFKVYIENSTTKSLVQCDLCDLYFPLRGSAPNYSLQHLIQHRGSKGCVKEQKKTARIHVEHEERAHKEDALRELGLVDFQLEGSRDQFNQASRHFNVSDLTPRASQINIRSQFIEDSPDSMNSDEVNAEPGDNPDSTLVNDSTTNCKGQLVEWTAGSIWQTYAYQQHDRNNIAWIPIGSEGSTWIRLWSKSCTGTLASDEEEIRASCSACNSLINSIELNRFMRRSAKDSLPPHTPYIYLNFQQLRTVITSSKELINTLKLENVNNKRKLGRLQRKVNDYQCMVILLSEQKITGVSRILSMALRNGMSSNAICMKLNDAISGTYRPRLGWSDEELDVAFLVKAIGGPRLLYALQKAEGYPSSSTVRNLKPIPEIQVSLGVPSREEIRNNIKAILGARVPPANKEVGQVIMIDGIAIEEGVRLDFGRNSIVGPCREHSSSLQKKINSLADIQAAAQALYPDNGDPTCHCGKDATVLGSATVTARTNYEVAPLLVSSSCKAEQGDGLFIWAEIYLEEYNRSPYGAPLYGAARIFATDGEASFRRLRFLLCLREEFDRSSEMGKKLHELPGLNCYTGKNGLIGTCDPKHIIKRFATMIRSPTGIQLGDMHVTSGDALRTLEQVMDHKAAANLLNPADKQNVPKAVNLIQSLREASAITMGAKLNPSISARIKAFDFISKVLNFFLSPFTDVAMTLSQQIRSLSTYSHLITALYVLHRLGFLTSALLADSQAIVKSIIFSLIRLQLIDPNLEYHILFEGTDRLENTFSQARTQDHARNFDILQLAQKLSIGAEVDAVFQCHPHLDRGHIRRNLIKARGIDHINPQSWVGNVRVGDVDVKKEYLAGRDEANKLMVERFGAKGHIDFDSLFSDPNKDHLRPGGIYIGFQNPGDNADNLPIIEGDEDDGNSSRNIEDNREADEFSDPRDDIDLAEFHCLDLDTEDINLTAQKLESHYLTVDGNKLYLPRLINEMLSPDKERRQLVTLRPLRAQGKTCEDALRGTAKLRGKSDGIALLGDLLDSPGNVINSGDLGGVLINISGEICMAVAEILNFHQGS